MPDVTRPPPGRGIRKAIRGAPTISSPPGDLGDSSGSFDILRTSGDPHSRGRGGIKSKELAGRRHGSSVTSCALRALPQPIRGFLGGMGCGTVMLKPLVVQGFRIVLQLALEGPLKFPLHRPMALGVDGLSVADVTFEEVGPMTPLLLMHQISFLTK